MDLRIKKYAYVYSILNVQSYKFCLFVHTFIYNKLGIIKKGDTRHRFAAFPNKHLFCLTR
ncbi:hypothetical protein EII33_05570 [Bacteroides heparinolyticus]|uniref:Uncharacterized protein n=1 Tax=Prevotella heparinolytica TaxID=28113 RepID=A0A3P2AAQ7_9BACE|nr:hypothetical protein EII33_05570 [Bacteroides heparinolyticus]